MKKILNINNRGFNIEKRDNIEINGNSININNKKNEDKKE